MTITICEERTQSTSSITMTITNLRRTHSEYQLHHNDHYQSAKNALGVVDKSCECVFIEIHNAKKQQMIIGELYRPPNHDVDTFNVSFNTLLTKLEKENAKFLLAGDYNINLINHVVKIF